MRSGAIDVRRLDSSLMQLGSLSKAANGSAVGIAAIIILLPAVADLNEDDAAEVVEALLANPFADQTLKVHAKKVAQDLIQRAKDRRDAKLAMA